VQHLVPAVREIEIAHVNHDLGDLGLFDRAIILTRELLGQRLWHFK
jgi:hypothetical protein